MAGSEGLDFKCIKQIHVLDPWFTLSRIEQIIGRGVRNSSHCYLPLEERCVEVYLHATELTDPSQESADLYLYRYAENKAIQIGQTNRLLKEISVDCMLNNGQQDMTVADIHTNLPLRLSDGSTIDYPVGDKAHTNLCDYMATCQYQCHGPKPTTKNNSTTLTNEYLRANSQLVIEKIKTLFQRNKQVSYTILELDERFEHRVPKNILYFALTSLINNQFETLVDSNGRQGRLINRGEFYLFQPAEVTDRRATIYERMVPPDYKPRVVTFDVPKVIQRAQITEDEPTDNLDELLGFIDEQIEKMFGEPLATNEKPREWTIALNTTLQELQTRFGIKGATLREYGINHVLNSLSFRQKVLLMDANEPNDVAIREFMDSKKFGTQFMVLYDKDTGTNKYLYKDSVWSPKPFEGWMNRLKQHPTSLSLYERRLAERETVRVDYGFMVAFSKSKEMIFKYKKYGDAGAGLYVANGNRSDAVIIVNSILKQLGYTYVYPTGATKEKKFDVLQLSVILEMLLRKHGRFFEPEFGWVTQPG